MSIAEQFTLPLRAVVTAGDGLLVLSDSEDRDVLVLAVGTDASVAKTRLQELADAFNAAYADAPEITPGEERAIRAFTRKGYVRRLGDQAGLAAIRGFSEGRPDVPSQHMGQLAALVAEDFLRERGYGDETD